MQSDTLCLNQNKKQKNQWCHYNLFPPFHISLATDHLCLVVISQEKEKKKKKRWESYPPSTQLVNKPPLSNLKSQREWAVSWMGTLSMVMIHSEINLQSSCVVLMLNKPCQEMALHTFSSCGSRWGTGVAITFSFCYYIPLLFASHEKLNSFVLQRPKLS